MSVTGENLRAHLLRTNANEFCTAFLFGTMPPHDLLTKYFQSHATITEHGPEWAAEHLPFLGFTFKGRSQHKDTNDDETCDAYFAKLGATLALHADEHSLPEQADFVVDLSANLNSNDAKDGGSGVVFVKANARLTALATQNSWHEEFVMVLSGFDKDGMIGHLEIWADNLSALKGVGH